MNRSASQRLVFVGTLALASLPSLVDAAAATDDLCERLHAEYLTKAQRALAEDKLEEALRYLLEAQAVAQKCAESSSERPLPRNNSQESGDASA